MRATIALLVLLASVGARADGLAEPRRLFNEGRAAFEHGNYQRAYDLFKRSFMLSSEPALLFNMASAQQRLGRPRDAAESLRAYLRAAPEDGDRPQIERRIRALDEQQRLLEAERPRRGAGTASIAQESSTSSPADHPTRRGLVIGLSVGAAVAVLAAVGIALGLTLAAGPDYTASPLGAHPGTR